MFHVFRSMQIRFKSYPHTHPSLSLDVWNPKDHRLDKKRTKNHSNGRLSRCLNGKWKAAGKRKAEPRRAPLSLCAPSEQRSQSLPIAQGHSCKHPLTRFNTGWTLPPGRGKRELCTTQGCRVSGLCWAKSGFSRRWIHPPGSSSGGARSPLTHSSPDRTRTSKEADAGEKRICRYLHARWNLTAL